MLKENEATVKEIHVVGMDGKSVTFKNVKIWTCESHVPMLVIEYKEGKVVFNLNNIEGYSFAYKEDE